jgi:hypothetical protein
MNSSDSQTGHGQPPKHGGKPPVVAGEVWMDSRANSVVPIRRVKSDLKKWWVYNLKTHNYNAPEERHLTKPLGGREPVHDDWLHHIDELETKPDSHHHHDE